LKNKKKTNEFLFSSFTSTCWTSRKDGISNGSGAGEFTALDELTIPSDGGGVIINCFASPLPFDDERARFFAGLDDAAASSPTGSSSCLASAVRFLFLVQLPI